MEFLRIFNRYQIRFEQETGTGKAKTQVRIPEEVIRKKKDIYIAMDNALKQGGKQLKSLFYKVDVD